MTTAGDSEFRYGDISNRLAHILPYLWWASIIPTVAEPLTRISGVLDASWWLFQAILLLSIFAGFRHARSICAKCVENAPLDPDQAVEKDGRWLRFFHFQADHSGTILLVTLGMVAVEVATNGFVAAAAQSLIAGWFGVSILGQLRHQRLSIWCPWCRGGGGDDEVAPDPAPPPEIRAPR